jgi:cation transporter family protein
MGCINRLQFGILLLAFGVLAISGASVDAAPNEAAAVGEIVDKMFKDYDKRMRPYYGEKPVEVQTSIYVMDVFNIDEVKHEFTVSMYFRHHWEDPRLTYKPLANMNIILLDSEHNKKVWIPDTFIPNERKTQAHSTGAIQQEMIRISPSGRVLRSTKITVTASCKMNLGYFPFDNQLCVLDIESYGYTANDIIYAWKEGQKSVGVSQEVASLKYTVTGFNTNAAMVSMSSGNYSRLGLEFYIVRNAARFMQDAYFPALVLVYASFLTFTMSSLVARIQIGVLLMGFTIIFMSLNSVWMPRVSYQTALDLYIFLCAIFVLKALSVNFILHMYHKPPPRRRQSTGMTRFDESCNGGVDDGENLCDSEDASKPTLNTKFDEILYAHAKRCKFLLPIAFLAVNVLYWMVVLIGSSGFPDDFILVENRG